MRPAILSSVLAMSAAASPMICSAASTSQSPAAIVAPLSRMNLSPNKPLVRAYGEISVEPREDRMPTSANYKPFTNGPTGSVGVICRPLSHALDSSPVGAASEGQPGSQSQTLGANLAYVFR